MLSISLSSVFFTFIIIIIVINGINNTPASPDPPRSARSKTQTTATTVLFTSPLYRANLHYRIVPKPPSARGVLEHMVSYILTEKKGMSGIVYCLSKKVRGA